MDFEGVKKATALAEQYESLDAKRRYLKGFEADDVLVTVRDADNPSRSVEFAANKGIVVAVLIAAQQELVSELYALGVYPPAEEKDEGNE